MIEVPRFELPVPDLSGWRAGNTGVEGVWRFDAGQPGPSVMISALVHGNELCGAWALKGLLEAGVLPRRGQLTLALCNLAAFDRFDPADHNASRFVEEDMNRQWTAERMASGKTLERRRAAELRPFVERADWLLDLHSMHERAAPLLLAGMQPRNLALARRLRAPAHVVIDAGHKDGTRMRDFGRFGDVDPHGEAGGAAAACSLLLECGFHGDLSSRVVAQDMCTRFLAAADVVDLATWPTLLPGWRQPDAAQQWVLEVTGPVVARSDRFRFTHAFQGLELIEAAGTVIGWNDSEPVITPYDHCVLVMPSVRQARAGVTVVRFARRRAL